MENGRTWKKLGGLRDHGGMWGNRWKWRKMGKCGEIGGSGGKMGGSGWRRRGMGKHGRMLENEMFITKEKRT